MSSRLSKLTEIYSQIYFARDPWLGLIIAAATFWNPHAGLSGIAAIVAAAAFRRLTQPSAPPPEPYIYCSTLLVGLSIGALFELSTTTLLLIASAAIFTYVLTIGLESVLRKYAGLPVLSIPFVLMSSLVYLAVSKSPELFSGATAFANSTRISFLPEWINGYFLALSAIVFAGNAIIGAAIAIGLLRYSRIAFGLSLVGYYSGALITGSFAPAHTSAFQNLNYFNYILIAIALGGIFLVPSIQSLLVAFSAVAVSHLILTAAEVFLGGYDLPVFTLPFNVAVLAFIYYADLVSSDLRTRSYLSSPEENLDYHRNIAERFGKYYPTVAPPFAGEWRVSQSFAGPYTHKGAWQFGLDFVVVDERGEQYERAPLRVEDFYSFNKPVLSPIDGTVVAAEGDCPDNLPGEIDRTHNWGNYVLIAEPRGYFVKVCHLKAGSLAVAIGTPVVRGQIIGRCGSSGYSPFPHIHIQVQNQIHPSAATVEFRLSQVVRNGRYEESVRPEEGDRIAATHFSRKTAAAFELLLGERYEYEIRERGRIRNAVVTVELDPDGSVCLTDGEAKLYFEVYRHAFRFYKFTGPRRSILRTIFSALPSIPLCEEAHEWTDSAPLYASLGRFKRDLLLPLRIFFPDTCLNIAEAARKSGMITSINRTLVRGITISSTKYRIRLGERKFIEAISVDGADGKIEIRLLEFAEAGSLEPDSDKKSVQSERMVAA